MTRAQEAESYYNEHYEDMAAFGPGIFMSLQYLAEAYKVLNKGIPIKVHLTLDNRNAGFEGLFTSYEQLERVTAQMLKPEFEERGGRYY